MIYFSKNPPKTYPKLCNSYCSFPGKPLALDFGDLAERQYLPTAHTRTRVCSGIADPAALLLQIPASEVEGHFATLISHSDFDSGTSAVI